MTGIEVAAAVEIGHVDRPLPSVSSERGEPKYTPRRGQYGVAFSGAPIFVVVQGDSPPPGRIWNITSINVVVTGSQNNEFSALGTWCGYVGDLKPNTLSTLNTSDITHGFSMSAMPASSAGDFVTGVNTLGTVNGVGLSRLTYWAYKGIKPYVIVKPSGWSAANVMLTFDYHDYADVDILPSLDTVRRVRRDHPVPVLPES